MTSSIHERIKYLRKNKLKMTQIEFGKQLGSAGSTVVGWEKGDRTPPDATIKLICKEFNVNYAWLKEGLGEMTSEYTDVLIRRLTEEYNLDELDKKIIESYLQLSKEKREVIKEYLQSIFIDKKDD
ncbi:MAG: helix-turn-helix transcriptional regulator [Coprobacillus sp.]|nr:helix-turn-helix transcriptional regulator [Coprobacillus sp.]